MQELPLTLRQRLATDFPFYASTALKIETKSGTVDYFTLNKAQIYLHEKLEEQRKTTGMVRAVVPKGRQLGCSTYVAGRFFHQVTHRMGCKAFILTHEADATKTLFNKADFYYQHLDPRIRPELGASNYKEMLFPRLRSGYEVGTAGNKGVGRSKTIQLFHGSEVAFWPHAAEHAKGVMQAIADEPGTEVILESTSNGIGNYYHQKYLEALKDSSAYRVIFIPWYWDDGYVRPLENTLHRTDEEHELVELYGLNDEQLNWRRNKISELGGEAQFHQEYPMTADESFVAGNERGYIPAEIVQKGMKEVLREPPIGEIVLGVDPARGGEDTTGFCLRKGRHVIRVWDENITDLMATVGRMIELHRSEHPVSIYVDACGLGAGVVDRAREVGLPVISVNSAETAFLRDKYSNRRAEMWGELKEWLYDTPVYLPDDMQLLQELTSVQWVPDSKGRIKLESKEDMKKRGFKSPNKADALALTFSILSSGFSAGPIKTRKPSIA